MPPKPSSRAVATLRETAARAAAKGHPWVFREGVAKLPSVEPGDVVEVAGPDARPLGLAIADPQGAIALRMLSSVVADEATLVRTRIASALAARARFVATPETTGYRALNGEGDGLPGVVIDRYADVAIVRVDGEAASRFFGRHRDLFVSALVRDGVVAVGVRVADPARGESKVTSLEGEVPPEVVILEHGMRMLVDLHHGQKTGAFLDQRENRRLVRGLSGDKRVLNLFSYSGGFSLAAALGGATHTTSVDLAPGGHKTGMRSFRENGLEPRSHAWVTADAFTFLEGAKARGESWDLIVCDPPSFAPNEKTKARGLSAYRKLHALAVGVLAKGGVFCAASCSSHVGHDEFLATLDLSATGRALRVHALFGPPADHPIAAAWPEGRYLKFAWTTEV